MIQGRCMRCKEKVDIVDPQITQTSRGGFMAKGKCPKHTDTTVCAIMSKDNAEKAIANEEAKKAY